MPAPFGNWIRFLILTGVRRTEALRACWSEIEGDLWHLPPNRTKSGRAFTVPLGRAALSALPPRGGGNFIFSTTGGARPIGGPTRIKADLDATIEADGAGPLAPWRFHDLRRTVATWLSEHGVDYVIADLCLGHAIPLGQVGRIYQHSYKIAERRHALSLWAAFLDPESAETTPLQLVAS
jgi:integrase